jgi:hypothetical protein
MIRSQFEECWSKIVVFLTLEKPDTITVSELSSVEDYLNELHDAVDERDRFESEITYLKSVVNRCG